MLNTLKRMVFHIASPKKFFYFSTSLMPWLYGFLLITLTYGLIAGLFLAPADFQQGDAFRIIYVHVPAAFMSLFIYGVMATAAVTTLVFKVKLAPMVIKHSAPIGASFTLLALITGSIWGKPMWGTWWIWDARLTSELILLFLYAGILLFQSATAQKNSGAKTTAVLVLIGFIDIPIIHYSVYWWNTLHQGATLAVLEAPKIAPSMLWPLLAMISAFSIYYVILLFTRLNYDLIALQNNSHWLRETTYE